jgi:hypothetical protein
MRLVGDDPIAQDARSEFARMKGLDQERAKTHAPLRIRQ